MEMKLDYEEEYFFCQEQMRLFLLEIYLIVILKYTRKKYAKELIRRDPHIYTECL
jgi:hypothetical protein